MEQLELQRIAKRYHIELIERPLPSTEDVEAIVGQRMVVMLEARLRTRDSMQAERFERFIPLARSLGER